MDKQTQPLLLDKLTELLKHIRLAKESAIRAHEFELAAILRDQETEISERVRTAHIRERLMNSD